MKRKRLLAWLLTLVMCLSEIGGTGIKAYAAGEKETAAESDAGDDEQPDDGAAFVKNSGNTMIGVSGIHAPQTSNPISLDNNVTPWNGSYVYFGKYKGTPVKYRMLTTGNENYYTYRMVLDCDNLLYKSEWSSGYIFSNDRPNMLTSLEYESIDDDSWSYPTGIENQKYGYYGDGTRKKNVINTTKPASYWLRDSEKKELYDSEKYGKIVNEKGEVTNHYNNDEEHYVSPTFYVKLYTVLFSSAVKGDIGEIGTEYKLTVDFYGLPIKITDEKQVQLRANEVTVPYTIYGENAKYANAVTVLITDGEFKNDGYGKPVPNILYYGKLDIKGGFASSKTGTFKLPSGLTAEGWGTDYRVYIIPEVINDTYSTDYAGSPKEIKKEALDIVESFKVTFDTKEYGTAPAPQTVEKGQKAVKPDIPKASGVTFEGWYSNPACTGDAFDFDTPITADITLYAKWVIATWKVSFNANCDDATDMPQPQTPLKGNCAIEPKDPKREGYAFGGWYKTASCEASSKYDFSKPVTGNITLYAKWKKLYEVSFDANGGSGSMAAVKVADGDYFTLPECDFTAPEKTEFCGWLIGSALRKTGTSIQITSDTVLEAYWLAQTYYTVTFHVQADKTEVEVLSGEKVAEPETPTMGEKIFLGWYTQGYADNSANDAYKYDFDTPVKRNLDLYAAWRDETKYHISVQPGLTGGGSVSIDKEYVMENEEVTVTVKPDEYFDLDHMERLPVEKLGKIVPRDVDASEFTKDGDTYTFTFRFPRVKVYEEHGGREYFDSTMTVMFKTRADHTHDLEKHASKKATCTVSGNKAWAECKTCHHIYEWDEEKDTIGFDRTWNPEWIIDPAMHRKIDTVEAKEPNCTVSGNRSYAVCRDCGTMWVNNNMGVEITMDDVILPIDSTAHEWDPATVSYSWADDLSTVTATCCCIHNSEHTYMEAADVTRTVVKEPTCEEDGIASYTSDAFANPMFAVQSKTGEPIAKLGHDWQAPVYEWSADLMSVTATIECSRDASHNKSETVAPKVSDMEGYKRYTATFTGEGFEEQVRDIAEVSFDMNGVAASDVPNVQKVDLNDPAVKPFMNPSAAGYVFTGWYSDEDATQVYDFDTPITKKTVIYAGWLNESATVFTVDFNMMGHGTVIAPVKVEDGKKLPRPVDPKASGMEFGGWYTEEECKNAYDFGTAVTKDFTLYAKWSEKAEPDPVKGGRSALDPLPEILSDTEDIYLVKGQKFDIPDGWSIARDDKASKKIISISKKGKFTAKKTGDAQMVFGGRTVKVHVYKPAMAKKSYKLEALATQPIELKDYPADKMSVLWYSASPDVATVDEDGKVTAHAKGSAKITAYINGSAYTCTVKVSEKEAVAKERTMHVTSGKSKTINVKVPGVKKLEWKSASDNIASVKKNKVTANAPGKTILSASANETQYTIELYSENLSISSEDARFVKGKGENKYSLALKKGDKIKLTTDASLDQAAVFKSSKPMVAFIDEDGNVEARSKGSGKFTTKLNGKTISVTVKVEE